MERARGQSEIQLSFADRTRARDDLWRSIPKKSNRETIELVALMLLRHADAAGVDVVERELSDE